MPPKRELFGINLDGATVLQAKLPGIVAMENPRNKYKAKPTEYNGVRYASKGEAARAKALDNFKDAGLIFWWIGQPKFRLGCPENVYVADFLVVGAAGTHVEDVKGMETPKFKRDKKLWMAYGPTELWIIKGQRVEIVEGRNGK